MACLILFVLFQVNCRDYLGNESLNLSAFLVDRNTPGVEISQPYNLAALNGLQVCDVTFDCEIPASSMLGTSNFFRFHWEFNPRKVPSLYTKTYIAQLNLNKYYIKPHFHLFF